MTLPAVRNVAAVTAAQMAEIDRAAVVEAGISIEMLVENASRGIAAVARELLGTLDGKRIVALAGHGNNGGDALGAARRLRGWGADARWVVEGGAGALRGLPAKQAAILERLAPADAEPDLAGADLVLDGLLGYSARGAPRGDVARLIDAANACGAPILAIDLPSGLDPDTGEVLAACIRARATVTLALPKTGLLAPAARPFVGDLLLADIGIPATLYERFGIDARRCFALGDLVRVLS